MKTLIFHDYLSNIGGGEKLMLTLARGLQADIATLDFDQKIVAELGYGDVNIIPLGNTIKIPPLKQISASLTHSLADYRKDYDFFIFSGNWSHYASKKHHPNLWYCHTPVRAFYSDYQRILKTLPILKRIPFKLWASIHRRFDQKAVKQVDKIITNSKNTQERIQKAYKRTSEIVYPCVDTTKYKFIKSGDFYLSVNRLYPEKRIELQFEAFEKMPDQKLVLVGGNLPGDNSQKYAEKLLKNKPENVQYLGKVTEEELIKLYGQCKAHITTAYDEDFGMTPIEAMSCGKPTIAPHEGGYIESITEDTGILIKPEVEEIINAIQQINKDPGKYKIACQQRAQKFDTQKFIQEIKNKIKK